MRPTRVNGGRSAALWASAAGIFALVSAAGAAPDCRSSAVQVEAVQDGGWSFESPAAGPGEPGESIVELSQHPASGVWSVWLDNGVLIHHREMATETGEIAIAVTIPHLDASGRGLTGSELAVAEAAAFLIGAPATDDLSAAEVRAMLRGKRVTVRASASADATAIRVDTRGDDAALAIDLLGLLLDRAAPHAEGLNRWKVAAANRLAAADRAPTVRARRELRRALSPDSVVTAADIESVTIERVQAWLDALGSMPIETAICGDIERVAALTKMADSLARLDDRERIVPMHAEAGDRPDREFVAIELPGVKPQAALLWAPLAEEPYRAATRRRLTIAMDALQQRLESGLLHEKQLVFNAGVQMLVPGEEAGAGGMLIALISEPERVEDSIAEAEALLERLASEGVDEAYIEKARARQLGGARELVASPRVWARYLSTRHWWSREIDDLFGVVERLEAEPADAINEELRALLDADRWVRVRVVGVPEAEGPSRPGPADRRDLPGR